MTKDNATIVKARIAEINVLMYCKTAFMVRRLEQYVYDFAGAPDIEIDVSAQSLAAYCEKNVLMNRDSAEYMLSGAVFYNALYRNFGGVMLHASAVSMDGEAYLFSANSGTGKSTHASLWKQVYGERVRFINDDKPAIRKTANGWYAYGTPWSGKTEENENLSAPLKGIAFLYRSEQNCIAPMQTAEVLPNILEQTIRPKTAKDAELYFSLVEDLVLQVPVYHLGCNMQPEAAMLAYETMNK